jgi:hypothetical protein
MGNEYVGRESAAEERREGRKITSLRGTLQNSKSFFIMKA